MKTTIEEQLKRKQEFDDFLNNVYNPILEKIDKIHKNCQEEETKIQKYLGRELKWSTDEDILENIWKPHNDILESPEWKYASGIMSCGPCYDVFEEDILDDNYIFPWGTLMKDSETFRKIAKNTKIGSIVMPGLHDPCEVLSMAFDYGDYYYKLKNLVTNKIIYDTCVDRLYKCKITKNDKYSWCSDPIWNESKDELLFHDKKYTRLE